MKETDFVPAAAGTYILAAIPEPEATRKFVVMKYPVLFYAITEKATIPQTLFDLPDGAAYVGLLHPSGEVSVAADRFVYASTQEFMAAALAMLQASGLVPKTTRKKAPAKPAQKPARKKAVTVKEATVIGKALKKAVSGDRKAPRPKITRAAARTAKKVVDAINAVPTGEDLI